METLKRQQGIALPVVLILLLVMLMGSVYLLRSGTSTTMTTANLAYDSTMSHAADFGLHTGFQWLSDTAALNRAALNADDAANGYKASYDTSVGVNAPAFWDGSRTVVDSNGNRVEYIVHRMCALPGAYDSSTPRNACVQTADDTSVMNNAVAVGDSVARDSPVYAGNPQLHYVITARIYGARGGNVVNQAVVMIGV